MNSAGAIIRICRARGRTDAERESGSRSTPAEEMLAHVLAIAPDVIDPSDADSDADPYVIAQALEVRQLG